MSLTSAGMTHDPQLMPSEVLDDAIRFSALLVAASQIGRSHPIDLDEAKRLHFEIGGSLHAIKRVSDAVASIGQRPADGRAVSVAVATLVGMFGTPVGSDPKIYGRIMAQRVQAHGAASLALERAIIALVDSSRYPPPVVDVLAAIDAEQKRIDTLPGWLSRASAIRDRLGSLIREEEGYRTKNTEGVR